MHLFLRGRSACYWTAWTSVCPIDLPKGTAQRAQFRIMHRQDTHHASSAASPREIAIPNVEAGTDVACAVLLSRPSAFSRALRGTATAPFGTSLVRAVLCCVCFATPRVRRGLDASLAGTRMTTTCASSVRSARRTGCGCAVVSRFRTDGFRFACFADVGCLGR